MRKGHGDQGKAPWGSGKYPSLSEMCPYLAGCSAIKRQSETPSSDAEAEGRGLGGRVVCFGSSDLKAQSFLEAQESSPHLLSSLGQSRRLPLKGFISMLMRPRRWAILFSSKNSISPFLAP